MRQADVTRNTSETKIQISINLDGTGKAELASGVPFLDHMLDLFRKHSGIGLSLKCIGDKEIDMHHSTEDIAITLGSALAKTLGDKKIKLKIVFVPFYFFFMNWCVFLGFFKFIKGGQSVLWEKAKRA